jgi:CubicO group peptidase (beta-lactamase class C family)
MINETDYKNNPLSKEQEEKIDDIFSIYDTTNKPGCAVGVIVDGRFIYKKFYGMANLDYDIPITSNSKFYIASTSKQFTATCILMLYIDGKIDLEDEVQQYIPELPNYHKPITIRHLLHHTGGLRDYYSLLIHSGFDERLESYMNNSEAVRLICKQKELDFIPGEKESYSNSGYILLAEIVNRVSGKSLKDFASVKIFEPLGMENTFFNNDCHQIINNKVISYKVEDEKSKCYNSNLEIIGDGGIITTLNDLLKWDQNFYKPVIGGKKLLDLLHTKGALNDGKGIHYACGLVNKPYQNLHNIWHNGGMFGFKVQYTRFPEQNTSIIILGNRADLNPFVLANNIADIIFADKLIKNETNSAIKSANSETSDTEPQSEKFTCDYLKSFTGEYYSDELNTVYEVILEDVNLVLFINKIRNSDISPLSDNVFQINRFEDWGCKITFTKDSFGNITGLFAESYRAKNIKFVKR